MAYKETHNKFTDWWMRVVIWREHHVKEKTFVLFLALFVGIAGGFAAQLLKFLIHLIATWLTSHFSTTNANYLYLVYPVVGILLTVLFVKYVVKDNISHGVTKVLYAISRNKSRLKRKNMYASLVASSITIGFGGSVGAEGPIVYTGAAIGSNVGQAFRLSPKVLMLLVGCGAAAGIAGIFRAPIAGMLFTLEVLMIDLTGVTVMPLLLSSIAGATVAYVLEGYNAEFFFTQSEAFVTNKIPYAIILGVICGMISYYFTKVMFMMESMFRKIKQQGWRIVVGGTLIAGMVFLFPPLYGEGYGTINNLLDGNVSAVMNGTVFYVDRDNVWFITLFIAAITLMKAFATSATNGAGGVGGTFAPSLFVGAFTGATLALACNALFHWDVSIVSFTLVGMAGVMSGVMNAPLTSIFLIAELSSGYGLFIPLMITSCISFAVDYYLDPDSIYTKQLRLKGELLTHDKDQSVFVFLKLDELMETDFYRIKENMTLGDIVHIISTARRNIFPVIDNFGHLLGVVQLDDLREDMFKREKYGRPISDYMIPPPDRILQHENIQAVMEKFDDKHTWMLPVVDKENRYLGFISKSRILNAYREQLVKIQQ